MAKLIIISGPSGVGKSEIIKKLMQNYQEKLNLSFSVSATTRKRRENEIDKISYLFVDKKRFKELIAEDKFLEYTRFINNYYGTLKKSIFELLEDKKKNVLLEIEIEGTKNIITKYPQEKLLLIYVLPPSLKDLKERIKSRAKISKENQRNINLRLEKAKQELKEKDYFYQHKIVNNNLETTVEIIKNLILKSIDNGKNEKKDLC